MVGWHHWFNALEFEQALGVGDGQRSLVCCSAWGCKELDTTEQLNWTWGWHSWASERPQLWKALEEPCKHRHSLLTALCLPQRSTGSALIWPNLTSFSPCQQEYLSWLQTKNFPFKNAPGHPRNQPGRLKLHDRKMWRERILVHQDLEATFPPRDASTSSSPPQEGARQGWPYTERGRKEFSWSWYFPKHDKGPWDDIMGWGTPINMFCPRCLF